MSKSKIVSPVVEMTSLRKMRPDANSIQKYEKGVSTAYNNIKSDSVSIFVKNYTHTCISFPCKVILLNKPQMYR